MTKGHWTMRETPITVLPLPPTLLEVTVSPDGCHIAFVAAGIRGPHVDRDGHPEQEFYDIAKGTMVFSPDGAHLVYVARVRDGWAAVLDGKIGQTFDGIVAPTFGPDGHCAYLAQHNQNQLVVVDGRPQREFSEVLDRTIAFSEDGSTLSYIARTDSDVVVVSNGSVGRAFRGIAWLTRSPKGGHIAYGAVIRDSTCAVIWDGRIGPTFQDLPYPPRLSLDGEHLAYVGVRSGRAYLVYDTTRSEPYDGVGPPVLSRDGKHVAFAALSGQRQLLVVDGRQRECYEGVLNNVLTFHAAGIAFAAVKGKRIMVVIDGHVPSEYDEIGKSGLVLSENGQHVGWYAGDRGRFFWVIDGQRGPVFDDVGDSVVFNPDGTRTAYAARRGHKWHLILDGQEGPAVDSMAVGAFSPDGAHFVYVAATGKKRRVFVDAVPGPLLDRIPSEQAPRFRPDGTLEYLGAIGSERGIEVRRFTYSWVPDEAGASPDARLDRKGGS